MLNVCEYVDHTLQMVKTYVYCGYYCYLYPRQIVICFLYTQGMAAEFEVIECCYP